MSYIILLIPSIVIKKWQTTRTYSMAEPISKEIVPIWEDREIRFDSKAQLLSCRRGEKVIDSINSVEDTKVRNEIG